MSGTASSLQERWRAHLGLPWFLPRHAVLVDDTGLLVRCGNELRRLNLDGEAAWRVQLGERCGMGEFLVSAEGGIAVTSVTRRPEDLDTIIAVDARGTPRWRTDLPALIVPGGALVRGSDLDVLGNVPGAGAFCFTVELDTGAVTSRLPLPYGGDGLIAWGERALVRTQTGSAAGLYSLGLDGVSTPVASDQTWVLQRDASVVLVSVGASPGASGFARTLAADDLRELWSSPAKAECAALTESVVVCIEPVHGAEVAVAHDATSSAELWRSEPFPVPVLTLSASGAVVMCRSMTGAELVDARDGRWLQKLDGFWSPPSSHHGAVYLVGDDAVVSFDHA